MTTLTFDLGLGRPAILGADRTCAGPEPGARGRLTLDDLVVGVWEGLAARRPAPCPVCSGTMTPSAEHRARPLTSYSVGRCGACGSMLG